MCWSWMLCLELLRPCGVLSKEIIVMANVLTLCYRYHCIVWSGVVTHDASLVNTK